VMGEIKSRVSREITKLIATPQLNQMQMQLLARAYHVKWTPAYRSEEVVAKLAKALDGVYDAFKRDPKLAREDKATPNPDWFGLGPSGDVIRLMAEPLQPHLTAARRANWSEMLIACRDWHRTSRRQYTNQSMIKDLYGIYLANRGIAVCDPAKAMPEAEARHYLYEAVGLQPWLGSDTANGPAKPLGHDYMQLTAKGLTKELGYVGSYGEVLDWMTAIYEARDRRPTRVATNASARSSPRPPAPGRCSAIRSSMRMASAPWRWKRPSAGATTITPATSRTRSAPRATRDRLRPPSRRSTRSSSAARSSSSPTGSSSRRCARS